MPFSKPQNQYRLGIILGFGALLWSGTYNALAKGLTPFLSPVSLLILSEALTAAFIIVTFGAVPLLRELRKMGATSIRMSIVFGLLNSAVAPLMFFTGLAHTSAVNASMLSTADILFILVAAKYILHERVSRMQAIGGSIVFAGILVLNVAPAGVPASVHMGDLFIFVAALVSGSGDVLFKKYLSNVMPEIAILIRNIAGIVAVSILGVFISVSVSSEVAHFPLQQVLLLLAFTFFSRYLNLTFYFESLDRLPASTLSLIQIGGPIAGIFFAAVILGESVHSYQVLGCTFIMFGLMLEQVSEQSITSLRTRSHLWHLPLRTSKKIDGNIAMLPKNV